MTLNSVVLPAPFGPIKPVIVPGSIVNDSTYNSVFQNAWRLIAASMVAYLFAQFVDVR
ncbi:MAG: VUT family protein, partial [Candidatus Puniceispirillaceae bacterium]